MNPPDTGNSSTSNPRTFLGLHYRLEPDYTRPLRPIPGEQAERLRQRLGRLYGKERALALFSELERVLRVHAAHATPEIAAAEAASDPRRRFDERDLVLITYGDLILARDQPPLYTLARVAERYFKGLITTLHLLPFFPSSSDRGFSVIAYEEVDPKLGSWDEIAELENSFKLMFDGVFNHISAKSLWFRQYLNGDPEFRDFFITFSSRDAVDPERLRLILRPRASDLLHQVHTIHGPRWVWTTFSADQVDLNFKNPRVLFKVIEVLLSYVRRGADLIRLDAVTYLWYELGTTCAHLEETHQVVKLLRDVLDVAAPHVALVSETNVPHADNITYFGDGNDEAQMVYNFALPPLVLHTFLAGDARTLTRWATDLEPPSDTTAFFNFLDSHDGIGLLGARGILSNNEILRMVHHVQEHGGFVSMTDDGHGGQIPYELNATWYSALNSDDSQEPVALRVDRFLSSRAVALMLRGVPGIYMPSLIGSRNDIASVHRDGVKRSINRSAMEEAALATLLADRHSVASRIARGYVELLRHRVREAAFHPAAGQAVLDLDPRVFALVRTPAHGAPVVCLVNVTPAPVDVVVPASALEQRGEVVDLISGRQWTAPGDLNPVQLAPYQVCWLKVGTRGA
jgi:sucrose phosphorylase